MSAIDWREFEKLLADYFRDQGYEVQHDGTAGRGFAFDGGVDLRLRKDGKLTLVQCKHENAYQTEHNVVNELLGIKVNEGADEAIVITSGEFTAAAKRFGSSGHVRLIDGVELRQMLGDRLRTTTVPSPSPWQAAAERFAWEAVDHIASSRGRRRRSNTVEAAAGVIIGKLVAGVAAFLFFVFVVQVVVPKILASALKPPSHSQRAKPESAPSPTKRSARAHVADQAVPARSPQSSAEISSAKQSQAEREAEVQRYLNRVPELTHYRYSPLDQNREPPADPAASESGR